MRFDTTVVRAGIDARSHDRLHRAADLRDRDLRARGSRQGPGLRLHPRVQSDPPGAGGQFGRDRGRQTRGLLFERHVGGRLLHEAVVRGRSRGLLGRRLRRHLAALQQGVGALWPRFHLRRYLPARDRAPGDPVGDQDALGRDPDQPAAQGHRYRGHGRHRQGTRAHPRRRFDLRDPGVLAPARTRRRHRHALDHQVPERPQPDHRRRGGHQPRRYPRRAQVHPEDHRRGAQPVRLLADARGPQDPAPAHGAPRRERPEGRGISGGPSEGRAVAYPGLPRTPSTPSPRPRCPASAA